MSSSETTMQNKAVGLKRSMSIAALIMMGSVFLSRVIGLVREIVLAGYGGTSFEIDAYITAFFIPEILNHVLAGGFLSVTFIPIFQRYAVDKSYDRAWRVFSNLITVGTILFVIFIPVTMYFTPQLLKLMGPHISDSARLPLTVKLTRIILPAQLFFYWGAFLMAVQMAEKKFFLPALNPLLYNLGIVAGGIFLGRRYGVEGFAWGVLIGAFLGNVVIQIPGVLKLKMRFKPVVDLRDPDLKKYVLVTIPLILGLGMSFSNEIFFRFFGSFLGEGGTASVNYALRTMMMVTAIFGQASGVAFFPFMSRLAAEKKYSEITVLLNSVVTRIALFLIPISAVMIAVAPKIIGILYQRGKFDYSSTLETAPVLAVYLTGAFAFSASMITVRCFYAIQNTALPMVVSTIIAIVSIPLYLVFSKIWGPSGIALAGVTAMIAQFITLQVIWIRRYPDQIKSAARSGFNFVKIVAVAIAGGIFAYFIDNAIGDYLFFKSAPPVFSNVLAVAISTAVPLTLVFACYDIMGIQKLADTVGYFVRKKARQMV